MLKERGRRILLGRGCLEQAPHAGDTLKALDTSRSMARRAKGCLCWPAAADPADHLDLAVTGA